MAPFRESGPLPPAAFARHCRRTLDIELSRREVSAVYATLQNEAFGEGKVKEAHAAGLDGERFLRRVHHMNATAKRLPRVLRAPVVGDWTRRRRYDPPKMRLTKGYSNPTLHEPVRKTVKWRGPAPGGSGRLRVSGPPRTSLAAER